MSAHEALRKAREFISEQGGVLAPLSISEEELNPTVQDDLSLRAYPIENTNLRYPVEFNFPQDSLCSEFAYFEDGKQRTIQIGFIPTTVGRHQVLVPIHFYVIAAVVMKRENRKLKVWSTPVVEKGIFIEKSLVKNQAAIQEFEQQGLNIVDISGDGDYYNLKRLALQEAKKRRLHIEDELIGRWRKSEEARNNFLVVDGTLMNFRDEKNIERCVGVSKSFGSRYFSTSDHTRIMQMDEFERSWTFKFHSQDEPSSNLKMGSRERISWYLRLRRQSNTEPEFGLIRVEISQRHLKDAKEYADRFSRFLLSDRLPTSYPAARWDNHLYPITACESYLGSVMPSISTICASMKG